MFHFIVLLVYAYFRLQSTMLASIERYLKQAIVDKNPSVSSAALVSSLVSFHSFAYLSGIFVSCK